LQEGEKIRPLNGRQVEEPVSNLTRLTPVQSDGGDQIGRPGIMEEEVPRAQPPERRGASLQKKRVG
jgi:hypothetical protein